MQSSEECREKTIRVYFADNTYKTLPLKYDSTVSEVLEYLCKKLSAGGRHIEPSCYDLLIIAPGNQTLRERRLQREDKPLQIQAKGGTAFKFLFREAVHPQLVAGAEEPGTSPTPAPADGNAESAGQSPSAAGTAAAGTAVAAEAGGSPTRGAAAADAGNAADAAIAPTAEGLLKSGSLDRLLDDGTWHPCTVILDEDRLWYSQAPGAEKDGIGRYGGGMIFLPLRECDRVVEGDDKKLLQLLTKGGTMTFRARNGNEKTAWLLAIVKQAAFIKERDILLQAELIISGMEFRRATQQVGRLEVFNKLSGVLATKETKELLVNFLTSEYQDAHPTSLESFIKLEGAEDAPTSPDTGNTASLASLSPSQPLRSPGSSPSHQAGYPTGELAAAAYDSNVRWPQGLTLKALADCLQRRAAGEEAEAEDEEADTQACAFIEETLFPRFLEHPEVQCRMCWIAAGIT